MKILILFIASLAMSLTAVASKSEMKELVKITGGSINSQEFDKHYKAVSVDSIEIKNGLRSFLIKTTKEKKRSWKKYVMTSGEYDHVSLAERKEIAKNPNKELNVKYLLEVSEVYAIYKGDKLIGYSIEILDYVQSAYYQDGAWYEMLLDEKSDIVDFSEESA